MRKIATPNGTLRAQYVGHDYDALRIVAGTNLAREPPGATYAVEWAGLVLGRELRRKLPARQRQRSFQVVRAFQNPGVL